MPGIGVIYNPRSGRHVRDPNAARRLARALGDRGLLREAGSLDQLYRAAEDFRARGVDVIGISGGDGTSGVAITGLLEIFEPSELPRIALLRGGTMNTVANAIGVRRASPERLLERLVRAVAVRGASSLREERRHVMRVEGEDARAVTFGRESAPPMAKKYGFLFGTGVVHGFLAEYYRGGQPSARVAAETLLRGIGSTLVRGAMIRRMAAPFRGSVELDDGTVWEERDYLAIASGTIDQIGLAFRPFHRYAERPSSFHVLGIHASPTAFVRQLPRILRSVPMEPSCAYDATTSGIVVRSPTGPISYMIDGDLHACGGALRVTIGPHVRFVVGT